MGKSELRGRRRHPRGRVSESLKAKEAVQVVQGSPRCEEMGRQNLGEREGCAWGREACGGY